MWRIWGGAPGSLCQITYIMFLEVGIKGDSTSMVSAMLELELEVELVLELVLELELELELEACAEVPLCATQLGQNQEWLGTWVRGDTHHCW